MSADSVAQMMPLRRHARGVMEAGLRQFESGEFTGEEKDVSRDGGEWLASTHGGDQSRFIAG
jgi:hypothetical protein